MNVSLPPLENHSCPLSAFPTFRIRCMEGCWLRPQELWFSPARPMLFARKSYGFGAQERFHTRAKPMVLEAKSAFRRGQERVGEGLRCRLLKLGLTKIIWPIGC